MASEKLISFVQEHPCLYDKSHRDFKDTGLKDNIWTVEADTGVDFHSCPVPLPQKLLLSHPNPRLEVK